MHFRIFELIALTFQIGIIACQQDKLEAQPGPDCRCVPFYQCKGESVLWGGGGLLDARQLPTSKLEEEEAASADASDHQVRCGDYHICCNKQKKGKQAKKPRKCGKRRVRVDVRMAGTSPDTTFGEWPWQGTLLLPGDGPADHFQCAGVLIDRRHALTVAHCVTKFRNAKPQKLFLRVGMWDTQGEKDQIPLVDVNISRIKIHPDFDDESLDNDIAVLKFTKPIDFSSHVDAICLPHDDESHDGETCVVTGWGKSSWVGSAHSRYLKMTELPVVNHTYCEAQLRKTRLGSYYKLSRNFMCAGGNANEDACKGDGGGPLACPRSDDTYALMGLVSWGIGCGEAGIPGVYVNVKNYLEWITSVTKKPIQSYWP